jgi:hypothetical protein
LEPERILEFPANELLFHPPSPGRFAATLSRERARVGNRVVWKWEMGNENWGQDAALRGVSKLH